MLRLLTAARGGSGPLTPAGWPNAASVDSDLYGLFATNAYTVVEGGVTKAEGEKPANGAYPYLYTRDFAYTLWHYPSLFTATQRRQFVTYYLSKRSVGGEPDGLGGSLIANLIPDRIDGAGIAYYTVDRPVWDGIAFVLLALWTDWNATGDNSTFLAQQSVIDTCLGVIPRAGNGAVHVATSAVDYGFTDRVGKTGDVAYGTALQAWAYKMCAEMAGEGGTGTYSTARADAEAGLATLLQGSGYYQGSSTSQAGKDDVWCTALAVAEGLVSGTDRTACATQLRDDYLAGNIAQNGLTRPLPVGENWAGYTYTALGEFQNGGYWLTPLWDCYRAVKLVDTVTAHAWVQAALNEVAQEIIDSGATLAPYEWRNGATLSGPKGYTAHAAVIHRFV